MQVAVLTFDGFNELDSFISAAIINRCRRDGLAAYITTPTPLVTSMNGVEVTGQRSFDFIPEADVVLVGSGIKTRDVVADDRLIASIPLDPTRQLIGSQCSGALVLARLGLLASMPACTDTVSRPWVEACGVEVLDAPFHAVGNIATAGGCLASQYLAAWVIDQALGETVARAVIHYVAPVGEKENTVERVFSAVRADDLSPDCRHERRTQTVSTTQRTTWAVHEPTVRLRRSART
jgi:transcriptional regulator GlxA family with amidase domain